MEISWTAAIPLLLVGLLGCAARQEIGRDRAHDYTEASLRVPPHSWQAERVNNIRRETIEETMLNLANFDDLHLVETSFSGMLAFYDDPRFATLAVPRLARVRRLLDEGRKHPEQVIPGLRRLFRQSLAAWPAAFEQFMLECAESKGARVLSEPDDHSKAQMRSLGATYVLAELGDYEALPLMVESYRLHDYPKILSPVPPGLTLYAMHRLVSSYPEEGLSAEARDVREAYLKAATCLPEPKEITVTAWNAKYHESDPRLTVRGLKGTVTDREPTMTLPLYPIHFSDGEPICWHELSPRAEKLMKHLERFVEAVFPEAETVE